MLKDIMRNGHDSSYGKVEMLKGDFSGYASVRIDKKNRIIFSVDDNKVTVIQCGEIAASWQQKFRKGVSHEWTTI